MKFKITETRTYTIEANSIDEAAEKYAELITANAEVEIEAEE